MKHDESRGSTWQATDLPRRQALRRLTAAGAVVALGKWASPLAAAADTPRVGGRIRVASVASSLVDTLDPAKGALSTDYARQYMVYSGLTQFDSRLGAQPGLAEQITSDDATLWTVKLRSGVEFHDGKPLTPADVVYSLLRHKDPAVASQAFTIAQQFADVRASGPDQIQIRLTAANLDLPVILADAHFLIIKDGTTDFRTAVGTGPYRCVDFNPGVRTVGRRNPNYWKPGRPYLEEIELIGIGDESSRVDALLAGDVQLVNGVNPRSVRRIRASGDCRVHETPSGLYTDLVMRQDMIPTGNPDFVLAMKYLLDREEILRAVFLGHAVLANDQPVPPSSRYFNPQIPQRVHDPDRARFHLRRADLPSGARLAMYASPAAELSVEIAALIQDSASRVGLDLAVDRVPPDGYWSNQWRKHPLTFGNVNPRPTVDMLFSTFFKSDSPFNECGWKNARFDQLLLAARSERDDEKRKQMYWEMQAIVHDQCGLAIPAFNSILDGLDRRLKGYGSIPIGGLMGYNFAEYVWLDT
ncbi:MAG: ABC transporter substrate-binding protein [Gammaproteobacteria bacterium]|nr:ABC transporter substrate-binding protein [Gammaproteobacteria bacterium]